MLKFEIGQKVPKPKTPKRTMSYRKENNEFKTCYTYGNYVFSKRTIENIENEFFSMDSDRSNIWFNKNDFEFEEFVLPKFWWIRVTPENQKDVSEWRGIGQIYIGAVVGWCDYFVSTGAKGHNYEIEIYWKEEDEINYEQFKKYIMKQEEKKLIGYTIDKKEYLENATLICDIDDAHIWHNNLKRAGSMFTPNSVHADKLKKAGVLDLWFKPVYEEINKDREFQLTCDGGTFSLTVTKQGFLYIPDNKYLNVKAVKDLIYPGFTIVTGYAFTPKISHLNMGCKKNVPVEDIHPLIKYWEENFKE